MRRVSVLKMAPVYGDSVLSCLLVCVFLSSLLFVRADCVYRYERDDLLRIFSTMNCEYRPKLLYDPKELSAKPQWPTNMSMQTQLTPMSVSVQTPASPQSLLQTMQMTNPGSQRTSNTNSLQKITLSRTVIKTSTKQLNMKLRRQKHRTEISLKNSSQHPTAMLCGKSPSINRNQHLQTMTPPSQIN